MDNQDKAVNSSDVMNQTAKLTYKTIQAVLMYLQSKPFAEVNRLIGAITGELKANQDGK
jgi:hypothetical protein